MKKKKTIRYSCEDCVNWLDDDESGPHQGTCMIDQNEDCEDWEPIILEDGIVSVLDETLL